MLDLKLFFPTVISWGKHPELAEQMFPLAKEYLDKTELQTDALEYTSTYNSDNGLEQYDEFKTFADFILGKGYEYLERCGYDSSKIPLSIKIFASEMKFGDSHSLHVHPNSLLSGVFYLTAPEGSSPILFSDTRIIKSMISLPVKDYNVITERSLPVFPEPGLLLLWESWVSHSVPKNKSESGRVTLVFNLSAKH